jgi:hypothetical protein
MGMDRRKNHVKHRSDTNARMFGMNYISVKRPSFRMETFEVQENIRTVSS